MHEILVAAAFIALLAVPALVSMKGEAEEDTLSTILERAGAGEITGKQAASK